MKTRTMSMTIKKVVVMNKMGDTTCDVLFEQSTDILSIPEQVIRNKFKLNGTPIEDFPKILAGKEWIETVNEAQDIVAKKLNEMRMHVMFEAALGQIPKDAVNLILNALRTYTKELICEFEKFNDEN